LIIDSNIKVLPLFLHDNKGNSIQIAKYDNCVKDYFIDLNGSTKFVEKNETNGSRRILGLKYNESRIDLGETYTVYGEVGVDEVENNLIIRKPYRRDVNDVETEKKHPFIVTKLKSDELLERIESYAQSTKSSYRIFNSLGIVLTTVGIFTGYLFFVKK
jgi:hypothetical protein